MQGKICLTLASGVQMCIPLYVLIKTSPFPDPDPEPWYKDLFKEITRPEPEPWLETGVLQNIATLAAMDTLAAQLTSDIQAPFQRRLREAIRQQQLPDSVTLQLSDEVQA